MLGIVIIGSVVASAYTAGLADATASLPRGARDAAQESLGAAVGVAHQLGGVEGGQLARTAQEAFISAAGRGLLIAAAVAVLGALIAWRALPARESPGGIRETGPFLRGDDEPDIALQPAVM